MKDKLEDFIIKNRDEFDFHTPDEQIWNKIKPEKKRRILFDNKLIKIAYRIAAVALIFFSSYAFYEYRDFKRSGMNLAQNDNVYQLIPDLKETESYYNNLVNLKMQELQPFLAEIPGLENEVELDISELDSIYSTLKKDLNDNIANDQVLQAMIQNYRLKIQILEDLLGEVKEEQNEDNTSVHI